MPDNLLPAASEIEPPPFPEDWHKLPSAFCPLRVKRRQMTVSLMIGLCFIGSVDKCTRSLSGIPDKQDVCFSKSGRYTKPVTMPTPSIQAVHSDGGMGLANR